MAENKKYYHNIDLIKNKLSNPILNPLTSTERNALASTLGMADKGYVCFDTTSNQQYFWNGVVWITAGGGGSSVWGGITGNILLQTDLTTYLSTNYYPVSNPSSYLTASALTPYLTSATAASTYAPLTFNANITVKLANNSDGSIKTLGRYVNNAVIPSNGLTAQQVITLLAQEALDPTLTLTSPTTIAFNQTAISNVLNFTKTINSLGATVATVSLEWRRNNTGSWTVLSTNTALTTLTHSLTDSAFNTQPFNYRYIVTDTASGTATATLNITPASYIAPSISFSAPAITLVSPETNTTREWGNTPSSLQGSWTRNSANVPVSSYTYSVNVNNTSYTTIGTSYSISGSSGSFASVSNTQATSTTTSIIYRVQVVDSYQTTTATYSINLSALIFYGEINVATTINSAAIRALPSRKFANDGVNPFTFSSGTTNTRWLVAMDNTYTLNNPNGARDTTQNIDLTGDFLPATSLSVNDAAGNVKTYNLYNYTVTVLYGINITIQITYT